MIFDTIPANELNMIESYIRQYAPFDEKDVDWSKMAPMDVILAPWAENKSRYLYQLMGEQLIIETEIEYEQDPQSIEDNVIHTLIYPMGAPGNINKFRQAWYEMIDEHASEFQSLNRTALWVLNRLMVNPTVLATNKWDGDNQDIQLPDGKVFRLQDGAKTMRAIRKIAQAYKLPYFQDFCNAHSLILNQKKIKGTLCLSIHPLDYMTMSDNKCDWDSCMSWKNEGSYRQGTVEMMNSPCVVVAYVKAKDDMRIDGDAYWNSKKWRELFIVSRDIITGVLGYPYKNDYLTKAALDILKELAEKNCGYKYRDNLYTRVQLPIGRTIFQDEQGNPFIDFHFETNYMYNDTAKDMLAYIVDSIFESKNKEGSIIEEIIKRIDDVDSAIVNYSGPSECMICGVTDLALDEESILCCDDCARTVHCSCCGDIISLSDAYELDGEYYCSECYADWVIECALCEEEHKCTDDNFITLEMLPVPIPEGSVASSTDLDALWHRHELCEPLKICWDCLNSDGIKYLFKEGQSVKTTRVVGSSGNPVYWVTPDMVSEDGFYIFFHNDDTDKSYSEWREAISSIVCLHQSKKNDIINV